MKEEEENAKDEYRKNANPQNANPQNTNPELHPHILPGLLGFFPRPPLELQLLLKKGFWIRWVRQ